MILKSEECKLRMKRLYSLPKRLKNSNPKEMKKDSEIPLVIKETVLNEMCRELGLIRTGVRSTDVEAIARCIDNGKSLKEFNLLSKSDRFLVAFTFILAMYSRRYEFIKGETIYLN